MSEKTIDLNKNFMYTNQSSQIYLNSSNAAIFLNGSMKSNVTFFFDDAITYDQHTMTKKLSIVNAQFPVSFYLINSLNNEIIMNGIKYIFPNGNYNIKELINQWYILLGSSWTLSYNSISNKLSFAFPSIFTFTNSTNSIMYLLGFDKNINYTSYITGSGFSLVAPYVINLGGILKLDVKTSSFCLSNIDSYDQGRTNTICSIPVNSAQNGYVLYNNFTNFNSLFRNSELSSLNIIIHDEFNNFIDFNNCDWSITIQLDVITRILDNKQSLDDVYKSLAYNYINK
jgi:hypothetical protein